MKQYIKNNHAPLAIGFSAGLILALIVEMAENIVVKIALIYANQ